jgi:hypothetical protein
MQVDFVPLQRLFDHQQTKVVERSQGHRIGDVLGGVGVDAQHDIREAGANGLDQCFAYENPRTVANFFVTVLGVSRARGKANLQLMAQSQS